MLPKHFYSCQWHMKAAVSPVASVSGTLLSQLVTSTSLPVSAALTVVPPSIGTNTACFGCQDGSWCVSTNHFHACRDYRERPGCLFCLSVSSSWSSIPETESQAEEQTLRSLWNYLIRTQGQFLSQSEDTSVFFMFPLYQFKSLEK